MIAFDPDLLKNTFLVKEAEALEDAGFIHASQGELIEKQLPAYQGHSNVLARIGIFILACLLYSSTVALITFIASPDNDNFTGLFFIYAIVGFVGLELVIRRMKYYAHGTDDAFLFGAQIALLCFVGSLLTDHDTWWPLFFSAILIGGLCCIRYVDQFSALLACFGVTALTINLLLEAGTTGKLVLPFVLLILAAGMFFLYSYLKTNTNNEGFYDKSLKLIYAYSLLLFYLSTNYFVVREANEILMNVSLAPGEDISLAFLFYGFTLLTPPVYIYMALRNKDRLMLWIGVICAAASIATIRYYYAVMPLELALIAGGLGLFVTAYLCMKKLKGRTEGTTFEKDRFLSSDELLNAEALILISNFSPKPVEFADRNDAEPGGGEFGGGGSGEKY